MRTWLSLLLFLPLNASGSCGFRPHVQKVYSLSGPITTALIQYGLLKSPRLKGLSVFYPLPKDFSGEKIPGGVFLSPEMRSKLQGSTFFFDESQELRRLFPASMSSIQAIEVKTRGQLPAETASMVTVLLRTVVEGCEKEEAFYLAKTRALMREVEGRIGKKRNVVFFLGEFRNGRAPEMVMANDGVVKYLRQKKLIETYPSELAYVHWSAKVLNAFPKDSLKVAIKDSGAELERKVVRHSKTEMTVIYPGALIPGPDQLGAWVYWLSNY